jgi:acetolactate synthase I/II/III large subunit
MFIMTKNSDLFVQCLENEGVEYIFGVPGEENLDFLNSLKNSKIKVIVTRHEQAAAFMAATIGRLTGKPGVCLSTLGPGATNFVTGSAYAYLGGMPMLMISGQKPAKKNKQGNFQIVDTVGLLAHVTKFSKQIIDGNSIPSTIREAFRIAEGEKPGPVHLVLPEDIAREETTAKPFPISRVRRPIPDPKAIAIALEMLLEAKRPLILIGAGANRKQTSKMLLEFINKTQIPFFNTQMGKGVIDERHPLYLGTAALSSNDYLHCAVENADLIINVGHDDVEKPPFIMKDKNNFKVLHINFYPTSYNEVYHPDIEIVGDIANTIWQISQSVGEDNKWDSEYFMKVKKYSDEKISIDMNNSGKQISPSQIVGAIRNVAKEEDIVALDNGMYKLWFARYYRAYSPNTLLLDNALATMGAGLPSAIACKIIKPKVNVYAVVGDGGFMMNSQEMETAVQLGLDLTVVIINDSGYAMIKWKQKIQEFEDFALSFNNPDFVKFAESFGAKGYRVYTLKEFEKTLKTTSKEKGIKLIEVLVDYSDNTKVFIDELGANKCNF